MPPSSGWVFAAHQLGAAVAATGAGYIRDVNGSYNLAFYLAAALCAVAAALCLIVGRAAQPRRPSNLTSGVFAPPTGENTPEVRLNRAD